MANGYKIQNQFALHFITLTTVGWVDLFTRPQCKDIIIDSLKHCQDQKGLVIRSYVIMSNHLHLVVQANEDSTGLSAIIRDFKRHTATHLYKWIESNRNESRSSWMEIVFKYFAKYNRRNTRYQIWQQDNHPIELVYPKMIIQKVNYIHQNPVKAKIVYKPQHYVYSSAMNYTGGIDVILNVELIDLGATEGFIPN